MEQQQKFSSENEPGRMFEHQRKNAKLITSAFKYFPFLSPSNSPAEIHTDWISITFKPEKNYEN